MMGSLTRLVHPAVPVWNSEVEKLDTISQDLTSILESHIHLEMLRLWLCL